MVPSVAVQSTAIRKPIVEVLLALVIVVLFSFSPLSSGSRPAISVGIGCVFGAAFFGYRWVTRNAVAREHATAPLFLSLDRADRAVVLGTVALVIALFLPTLIGLLPWYTESVWRNGHGLFLPLLVFAVARVVMRDLTDAKVEGSPLGLVLLVPGLLFLVVDSGVHSIYLAVLGMPLVAAGTIVTFLGPRWARALAVPILMLLFFAPISSGIATLLEFDESSAICTQWVLELMGRHVARDGVILLVDSNVGYGISPRCAGFSIFYGAVAVAIALGTVVGSWKRALALAVIALPLTIFANGVRVAVLIVVCEWRGIDPNATMLHGVSGIAAYLGVIFAMFLLAGRAARLRLVAQ